MSIFFSSNAEKMHPIYAMFFKNKTDINTDKCAYGRISIRDTDSKGVTVYETWAVRGFGKAYEFVAGLEDKTPITINSCSVHSNYVKDKDGNGGRFFPYIAIHDATVSVKSGGVNQNNDGQGMSPADEFITIPDDFADELPFN